MPFEVRCQGPNTVVRCPDWHLGISPGCVKAPERNVREAHAGVKIEKMRLFKPSADADTGLLGSHIHDAPLSRRRPIGAAPLCH